jgi:hypothetical protein
MMHKWQRRIFHLVLAVVVGGLAWWLGTAWTQANLRYGALSRPAERRAVPLAATPRREPPATEEIAAKNLFSADRTSEVVAPEVTESQPPPPAVPAVFGTMKLGESYEALMAEAGNAARGAFRRVKPGEQFGGYTVVEILDEKVVIEYRGERTTVGVYQSARSVARPAARTETAAAPTVAETGRGGTPASASATRQAGPATARVQASQPAPPPPGTPPGVRVFVEANRRRFERDTVFGVQTWFEPLEQPSAP